MMLPPVFPCASSSRARWVVASFFAITLAAASSPEPLTAAAPESDHPAVDALVREALTREIYGETQERADLLERAAAIAPEYGPAMWHRGYLQSQGKWISESELDQQNVGDKRLAAYQKIRSRYEQTAQDQLRLADWCRQRGLLEQERAHLNQVVQLAPNHPGARERLGFVAADGVWFLREDLQQNQAIEQRYLQDLQDWRKEIVQAVQGLRQTSQHKREAALNRLQAIDDPSAVPALEQILATESEACALQAIALIARFDDQQSTTSLAQLSMTSPWPTARRAAAEALKPRDEMSYIPTLLGAMHTPTVSRLQVFSGRGGRVHVRHAFYREGQGQGEMMVLDTTYRRIALPDGDGNETLARAAANAQLTAFQRERELARQNAINDMLNTRAAESLQIVSGQVLPPQADAWWTWWNQHNGVFVQGPKPQQTKVQQQQLVFVDQVSPQQQVANQRSQQAAIAAMNTTTRTGSDCLAAGTLIRTATGFQAVDKLQVGDLVLSQDVETGELALKPVLALTVRPLGPMLRVEMEGDAFECSEGHPFFVAGDGWVKARDLKSGMEMHGCRQPSQIFQIGSSEPAVTYNLVVADFHTYFVGEAKVLSHDNTIRAATRALTPGLSAE
ncbi:polymorphic toxin-type HINT domain-containing protein [Lignipirellula cremea]|uniref:Hint domain-containing protein n=1 Tax=Lignipirellula cremea TaxID=2528010 RepID=A0A518DMV6_9BACT|nr:polymorphic toxin-type HINT domain-containing protein [Lignipirellula cremea]QDU93174.1 hypothetical protein Pla8534_09530 [Lignipirellula cremea]